MNTRNYFSKKKITKTMNEQRQIRFKFSFKFYEKNDTQERKELIILIKRIVVCSLEKNKEENNKNHQETK